jgi:hypothetical protein
MLKKIVQLNFQRNNNINVINRFQKQFIRPIIHSFYDSQSGSIIEIDNGREKFHLIHNNFKNSKLVVNNNSSINYDLENINTEYINSFQLNMDDEPFAEILNKKYNLWLMKTSKASIPIYDFNDLKILQQKFENIDSTAIKSNNGNIEIDLELNLFDFIIENSAKNKYDLLQQIIEFKYNFNNITNNKNNSKLKIKNLKGNLFIDVTSFLKFKNNNYNNNNNKNNNNEENENSIEDIFKIVDAIGSYCDKSFFLKNIYCMQLNKGYFFLFTVYKKQHKKLKYDFQFFFLHLCTIFFFFKIFMVFYLISEKKGLDVISIVLCFENKLFLNNIENDGGFFFKKLSFFVL